jgi:hypothetical protein
MQVLQLVERRENSPYPPRALMVLTINVFNMFNGRCHIPATTTLSCDCVKEGFRGACGGYGKFSRRSTHCRNCMSTDRITKWRWKIRSECLLALRLATWIRVVVKLSELKASNKLTQHSATLKLPTINTRRRVPPRTPLCGRPTFEDRTPWRIIRWILAPWSGMTISPPAPSSSTTG